MSTDPTPQTPDSLAGDQKTTLKSAEWTQSQLNKFGIYTKLYYNPYAPGMDYIFIDEFTRSKVDEGEHIFLLEANGSFCNADLILKNLENDNLNAYYKIDRCLIDLQYKTHPNDLPSVQKLTNDEMQRVLDS